MDAREAAAHRAVALIEDGMTVGMGSGSTVDAALMALGERVREGLRVCLVVASSRSEATCRRAGLVPEDLDTVDRLDLVLDGADEVDPRLNLIKGGGAALVREKLLAVATERFIVMADEKKRVQTLGAFPLPVAVIPFGARHTASRLARYCEGVSLRVHDGKPVVSDDGLRIVDMRCGPILDPERVERELKSVAGVAEVGLFVGLTTGVIFGRADGSTEIVAR